MAIFFEMNSSDLQFGECHIGMPPSAARALNSHFRDCMSAQADGDELMAALRIVGRNQVPHRVWTFINEEAQLICANWK